VEPEWKQVYSQKSKKILCTAGGGIGNVTAFNRGVLAVSQKRHIWA